MAMKVLTDFHHSSLLTATNMLFEDRLGMEVYRPIGMEWFDEGFWAINDQRDTAEQYLRAESQPLDNTPALNESTMKTEFIEGTCRVWDPGRLRHHKACTLEFFKNNQFDYVIASIPQHVELYKKLIKLYSPGSKLIVQLGNNWPDKWFEGENVLASISFRLMPANAIFYHQEFSLKLFRPKVIEPTKQISSYVNILSNTGQGWIDFIEVERLLKNKGYKFKSYGGQCRDGNMNGPLELANSMHDSQFVFHSKPGGDGFGHILHNAYACGRPVIARPSQYKDQLGEQLMIEGSFIDLDKLGRKDAAEYIDYLTEDTTELFHMSQKASKRFAELVDYQEEADRIRQWLAQL